MEDVIIYSLGIVFILIGVIGIGAVIYYDKRIETKRDRKAECSNCSNCNNCPMKLKKYIINKK